MMQQSWHLLAKPSFIRTILNPFLWYDCCRWLRQRTVFEEFLLYLIKKYPRLESYYEHIIAITNAQRPCPVITPLLSILKERGYQLYIFSNIGEYSFIKLYEEFPTLFVHFDGIMTAQSTDNWIQKPQQNAFKKFITFFNLQPRECIFIDNSVANIHAALEAHFNTIHYVCAQQLLADLQLHNIKI